MSIITSYQIRGKFTLTKQQQDLISRMKRQGLRIVVKSFGNWTHSVLQVIQQKHKKEMIYNTGELDLKSLVENGYLQKTIHERKGISYTNYYVNPKK